jgi:glycosyltransferase involved in cell wall biosynthesis
MTNNIYILTNFSTYLKSFSPILVVENQLKMLTRAGYRPTLIVTDGWEPPRDTIFAEVETVYLAPITYQDPPVVDDVFREDVNLVYEQLKVAVPEGSIVFTHDLIFLPDYTKFNIAARRLAEEHSTTRWIHWVHSATGPNTLIQERDMYGEEYRKMLGKKFPNSIIAYPNAKDIPRVARNFGYEEYEVVEIPHSTDPTEGMHPIVKRLYDQKGLGEVEVLVIAPMRLDRGKAPEMIVRVMGGLKEIGMSSHVIFCDFQSTGGDKVTLREECKQLAKELGVEDRVTFISEFDDACQLEVSHEIVLDLFTLSNVFFCPSRSETYSLTTQEAMLKGNLCILNQDFPAFMQIYGDKALYRQFNGAEVALDGFDGKVDTTHSNIDAYFKDRIAVALKAWLNHERVLKAKTWVRTKRNPDYIFREYVEPLIMENTNA